MYMYCAYLTVTSVMKVIKGADLRFTRRRFIHMNMHATLFHKLALQHK